MAGRPGRRTVAPGTAEVTRVFRPGDEIRLELPVAPRWTRPDPRINAIRGAVAVERGPLVYCAESVDLPGERDVDTVRVDTRTEPHDVPEGAVVAPAERAGIVLVPYNSWANRGPSTMRVWLPAG